MMAFAPFLSSLDASSEDQETMTESQGATPNAGAPTYAELRRGRDEDPSGGEFLSGKNYPNGADVEVTGVEVRQNANTAKFRPGAFEAYWRVNVKNGPTGALLRESKPMSDKLGELEISDPTGKSFIMMTEPVTNGTGRQWKIARVL